MSTTSFASSKSCIVYRGGHFAGRERLDFLRFLSEMNMDHVVEKIFSFLGAVDLCRVACTSVRWHDSLISDSPSNLKRIDFLIDCKKNRVSCPMKRAQPLNNEIIFTSRKTWKRVIERRVSPRERPWAMFRTTSRKPKGSARKAKRPQTSLARAKFATTYSER